MTAINKNIDLIKQAMCRGLTVGSGYSLERIGGVDYVHVVLPFYSLDGTNLEFFIRQVGNKFTVTDFGLTLMNLESNSVNLSATGIRQRLEKVLKTFAPESDLDTGEIKLIHSSQAMDSVLIKYIHALSMISTFGLEGDTRVGLTFDDEVNHLFSAIYGERSVHRDWYDSNRDPEAAYKTDFKIDRDRKLPVIAFGIYGNGGDRVSKASLTFSHFREEGIEATRVLVCKDFSKLSSTNKKRAEDYSDFIVKSFSTDDFDFEVAKADLMQNVPQ